MVFLGYFQPDLIQRVHFVLVMKFSHWFEDAWKHVDDQGG